MTKVSALEQPVFLSTKLANHLEKKYFKRQRQAEYLLLSHTFTTNPFVLNKQFEKRKRQSEKTMHPAVI